MGVISLKQYDNMNLFHQLFSVCDSKWNTVWPNGAHGMTQTVLTFKLCNNFLAVIFYTDQILPNMVFAATEIETKRQQQKIFLTKN